MDARLTPITQRTAGRINFQASRSVFWELEPATAATIGENGDGPFEKEAWLATTLSRYGTCGFNLGFPHAEVPRRARATVLYCDSVGAPGVSQLPTAPLSEDAHIVTSLFIDPGFESTGLEAVLLDTAIMDLVQKEVPAVEAFGLRAGAPDPYELPLPPDDIGLIAEDALLSAGFEVTRDHPVLPRLRLELPPARGLLAPAEVEQLLSGAEAVVS